MFSSGRPTANLVGALGDAAHVDAGLAGVGLPVVQRGFEVIREPEAEPHEAAFADERARATRRDTGALQGHDYGAARLRLVDVATPRRLNTSINLISYCENLLHKK